ncbi:hypothetical protein RPMA_01445 [Tardiphaga alba]|uniref:Uncharacterized protein n=1 Tax=Tardiphaga alba TaxID=340268 RepID=A0ABX8A3Y8_9BRAD|nr:hypothetical protein [Tardiphaga alba]QUS37676.1 hypothetical protein RPMA_01445 [Tardiphaga alba]
MRRMEVMEQVFDLNNLRLCRSSHGDLESCHDQTFSGHGECVVTIRFGGQHDAISSDQGIAANVQIECDGG